MEENTSKTKKPFPLFIVLTVILSIVSIYLGIRLYQVQNSLVIEISTNDTLLAEKQKMIIQLENLQIEYSQLKEEYETLGDLFDKEQEKIEK